MKRRGPLAWSWMAVLVSLAATQPAERVPSIDPNHYLPSMNPCYDESGVSQRCVPDFINVAFTLKVDVSNTCGVREPTKYCVQSGAMGHAGISKNCDICDNRDYRFAHPPEYLTDFNNPDNETWWQSETMNEGVQHPNNVTLTLGFRKAYDITYVRLKFMSPRPESFAIYKKTTVDGEWIPWQFYSGSCRATYHMAERAPILPGNEAVAQCTREFSDISPLTGGNIAFSTLDGRPSAENFEESEVLQEWVTAVAIRVVLSRLNTFGDEVFRDPRVLKSYYYAISDLAVGGRCKCNGHASQCVRSTGGGEDVFVCDCKHHTTGADCQICEPFYHDRPWRAATSEEANECLPCECNGLARRCYFDDRLYAETGHGGHCLDCAGNTHGPHCEHCAANHWRRPGETFCVACGCSEKGSSSLQCDEAGQCPCKPGVTGQRCDQCQAGHFDLGPSGCQDCRCEPAGSRDNAPDCSPLTGECSCKANVEGRRCDKCKPGYFNLSPRNHYGCTPCFCYGHSSVCAASEGFYAVNVSSNFFEGNDKWTAASDRQVEEVQWADYDKSIAVGQDTVDTVYFHAPAKFVQNLLFAYNQKLSFTLQLSKTPASPPSRDVIILGKTVGQSVSARIALDASQMPSKKAKTFTVLLHESQWSPRLSSTAFMAILADAKVLGIRGGYSERDVGYLSNVTLSTASESISLSDEEQYGVADWVETCNCTEGYIGQFCESCAPGYRREVKFGGALVKCVLCDCHDHSESCDAESGACICQHNTAGDSCESCSRGYYGNAFNGTSDDCKKCDCPEDGPCVELPSGEVVCTECPQGHTGASCEFCEADYFGDPAEGISCLPCPCHGNTDPNEIAACHPRTGECRQCVYNTEGTHCDRCVAGYYGNATAERRGDCQPCGCHERGSVIISDDFEDVTECDRKSGQCKCRSHVIGQRCDACEEGFFNLTSGSGCQACDCDPLGSLNVSCEVATGRCVCKPGVTGRRCDQCIPMHYGFSADGCRPCDCDRLGSESLACDVANGQCLCRENVEGRRCDQCSENRYNLAAGCLACDDCYTLIQQRKDEINSSVVVLRENIEDIATHPVDIDDPVFAEEIDGTEARVKDLRLSLSPEFIDNGTLVANEVFEIRQKLEKKHSRLLKFSKNDTEIDNALDRIDKELFSTLLIVANNNRDLKEINDLIENDGMNALDALVDAVGNRSYFDIRVTEISEEIEDTAERHAEEAEKIVAAGQEALLNIGNALSEASETVFGTGVSRMLSELHADVNKTVASLKTIKRLAQAVENETSEAEHAAAEAIVRVDDIVLPQVAIHDLQASAKSLIGETQDQRKEFERLVDELGRMQADVDRVINDTAQLSAELAEIKKQRAAEIERLEAAWKQAEEDVERVNDLVKQAELFLDEVPEDIYKDRVSDELAKVPEIRANIDRTNKVIAEIASDVHLAKETVDEALRLAKDAERKATAEENNANKLVESIAEYFTEMEDAQEDLTKVQSAVLTLQDEFDRLEPVNVVKARVAAQATTAMASVHKAKALNATLASRTATLEELADILAKPEILPTDDELDALEAVLLTAKRAYKRAHLEKKVKKLRNKLQKQQTSELAKELADLENEKNALWTIYNSLPESCVNVVRLETGE